MSSKAELERIAWQFLIATVRFVMLLAFIGGHWVLLAIFIPALGGLRRRVTGGQNVGGRA